VLPNALKERAFAADSSAGGTSLMRSRPSMLREPLANAGPAPLSSRQWQSMRPQLVLCQGAVAAERVALARALDSLYVVDRPIVSSRTGVAYGWIAELRTREPSIPDAPAILRAALRQGWRDTAARRLVAASLLARSAEEVRFVPLHPQDLLDGSLRTRLKRDPRPSRFVLELSDRAPLCDAAARARVATLRSLGARIAVTDLGVGDGGLASFAALEPDVVKLDKSLVRGIAASPTKRRVVASLVSLCVDLGVVVVGTGVEARAEAVSLAEIGCDLQQGAYFQGNRS
jgi:EAL domain-containing protein (putative c-di-GMP-specific phosphodiesterase class I)